MTSVGLEGKSWLEGPMMRTALPVACAGEARAESDRERRCRRLKLLKKRIGVEDSVLCGSVCSPPFLSRDFVFIMGRGLLLTSNLPQLQNLIKRDPAAYREEFFQQWTHYKSIYEIFKSNPDEQAQNFRELITFISQVGGPCVL